MPEIVHIIILAARQCILANWLDLITSSIDVMVNRTKHYMYFYRLVAKRKMIKGIGRNFYKQNMYSR